MVELIIQFLKITILLAQYFFGKAAERSQRIKEIADQFKAVTIEGDNLFKQVWDEMNQRSDTDWNDIPTRNNNEGDSNEV